METREASIGDLDTILRFAIHLHRVGYFGDHDLNVEKLANHLLSYVLDSDKTIIILAEDERAIGFISGEIVDLFFNDDVVVQERLMWVEPKHRSLRAVRTLIDAFAEWGEDNGVSAIHVAIANGYKPEAMTKLLTRYGFTAIGGYYVR